MSKPFYDRLKAYYLEVGAVLRGEAGVASIFPNTTDIGMSRERIYAEFLRTHLPSCCNVSLGGFVFNLDGNESKQVDLLVTSDICPQYNFHNRDGQGKTFACVEGLLAAVSIKSKLTSPELVDSLENLASLPPKKAIGNRCMPLLNIPNYEDWPFKIVYASDGVSLETLLQSLAQYYQAEPEIPVTSRPNLIHVAGKYNVVRVVKGFDKTRDGTLLPEGKFHFVPDPTDVFALAYAVQNIQKNAVAARHVIFTYNEILDKIPF